MIEDPTANCKFILDKEGNPIPELDLVRWATWFEESGSTRVVAQDYIGNYEVSTVFLALDYSFVPGAKPLVFETMIFKKGERGDDVNYQERCTTKLESLAQHQKAIRWLRRKKYVKSSDKVTPRDRK